MLTGIEGVVTVVASFNTLNEFSVHLGVIGKFTVSYVLLKKQMVCSKAMSAFKHFSMFDMAGLDITHCQIV